VCCGSAGLGLIPQSLPFINVKDIGSDLWLHTSLSVAKSFSSICQKITGTIVPESPIVFYLACTLTQSVTIFRDRATRVAFLSLKFSASFVSHTYTWAHQGQCKVWCLDQKHFKTWMGWGFCKVECYSNTRVKDIQKPLTGKVSNIGNFVLIWFGSIKYWIEFKAI